MANTRHLDVADAAVVDSMDMESESCTRTPAQPGCASGPTTLGRLFELVISQSSVKKEGPLDPSPATECSVASGHSTQSQLRLHRLHTRSHFAPPDLASTVQVLALEAALESQRLDTEDRIAQASKAAVQTAAELRQQMPTTPTHDGLAASPGRLALDQDAGSLSPLDRVAGALIKGGAAMFQGSPSRPTITHAAAASRTGPHPGTPSSSVGTGSYETELDRRAAEAQRKAQALALQQRNENQDTLVVAISRPLGFDRGRPVAAVLIFRCVLPVELAGQVVTTNVHAPVTWTIMHKLCACLVPCIKTGRAKNHPFCLLSYAWDAKAGAASSGVLLGTACMQEPTSRHDAAAG
jgi:hypothetical protein